MFDTWGGSWGTPSAWGVSWGQAVVPPAIQVTDFMAPNRAPYFKALGRPVDFMAPNRQTTFKPEGMAPR